MRLSRIIACAFALYGIAPAMAEEAKAPETTLPDYCGRAAETTLRGALGWKPDLPAGLSIGLQDVNEAWGNPSGGRRQGASYNGLSILGVCLDTSAYKWDGGLFYLSGLQIRGRNIATDNLLNLQTPSGNLAQRATRLWEVWFQQSFNDNATSIRVGQQSLDQEFIASTQSGVFINTMMGWPMLPSANLYAGGPAYPLSSLGVRLSHNIGPVTLLGGVFQDNPPGGPFAADSQLLGSTRWGGNFNLRTGALAIAEIQYAPDKDNVFKLGAWYDSGAFPSQRFDTAGMLLASPRSNGNPAMLRDNWSLYGVIDIAPTDARPIGVFARAMGGPGDRNLISFSINAGITANSPLPGRDKSDVVGLGFGVARLSSGAISYDRDLNFYGIATPVRSAETFVELTYKAAVTAWWTLQPDFQYVFTPGGGIANPLQSGKRIGNEAIIGMRSTMNF